ncbi:unnamed protein product [Lota lota]
MFAIEYMSIHVRARNMESEAKAKDLAGLEKAGGGCRLHKKGAWFPTPVPWLFGGAQVLSTLRFVATGTSQRRDTELAFPAPA